MNRLASYETLIELASGGMATVFVARHSAAAGFERLVAIKRVHRHLLAHREFCDLFRDEARVSSAIRHPNVVSATDVVEMEGELLLVMDYIESSSLAGVVHGERIPPAIAARIFVDVLAGLHAAHEAVDLRGEPLRIVHRDVSPQNVLVGTDGVSRLIDFGIAKAAARLAETSGGSLRGKLRYMSPEQMMQKPLDRRADVFSAGIVLYELLTGQRLFRGEDEGDIALAVLVADIKSPSAMGADVSPELDAVVLRALTRERDERWQTAAEMGEALERAITPASPREVAAWLEGRVGDEIRARRQRLRDVIAARSEIAAVAGATEDAVTQSALAPVVTAAPRPVRAILVGVALAAGAVAIALAIMLVTRAPRETPHASMPSSPPAASSSASPSVAAATETALPSASAARSSSPPPASPPPARANARPRATGDLHRNPYAR